MALALAMLHDIIICYGNHVPKNKNSFSIHSAT